MNSRKFDYTIKTVIVGDSGVGKTCLLVRFIRDFFNDCTQPTLGVDFLSKIVDTSQGHRVELQLWDTAGQELFRSVTRGYYRGSAVAYLVFDLSSNASFINIERWLSDIKEVAPPKIVTVLIGNKSDLTDKVSVKDEDIQEFIKKHNMKYYVVSAKTGNNVEAAFLSCIEEIDQNRKNTPVTSKNTDTIIFEDEEKSNNGCSC